MATAPTIVPAEKSASDAGAAVREEIAWLALECARLLMQAGANCRRVEDIARQIATGLGADGADMRVGYASLTISVHTGNDSITRMCNVGPPGVNQRLDHALHLIAQKVADGDCGSSQLREELDHAIRRTRHQPVWVVAIAVGIACAAFGRLLGADWQGVLPIFAAAALSQSIRHAFAAAKLNPFVSAAAVAFIGATLSGLCAQWVRSATLPLDMAAAILLLVPGVPALNAQIDILEGRPSIGSARIVWLTMYLVFVAAGVWFSLGVLEVGS